MTDVHGGRSDEARGLDFYEAVPYLLVIESVERGGEWLRRAEYPELPGCVAEAECAVDAIEQVEQERHRVLRELWSRGAPIPVPRPPLRQPRPAGSPVETESFSASPGDFAPTP